MSRVLAVIIALGLFAGAVYAERDDTQIKLRDSDLEGLMGINANISLSVTFDVRKEDLIDDLHFDFYILLEPRDDEVVKQFFHCRTTHRFLEEDSGYTTGVYLDRQVKDCINPRHSQYAVVVSYNGEEVGVENSEKERWWEDSSLGQPIENVLSRSSGAPMVRNWEADQ